MHLVYLLLYCCCTLEAQHLWFIEICYILCIYSESLIIMFYIVLYSF